MFPWLVTPRDYWYIICICLPSSLEDGLGFVDIFMLSHVKHHWEVKLGVQWSSPGKLSKARAESNGCGMASRKSHLRCLALSPQRSQQLHRIRPASFLWPNLQRFQTHTVRDTGSCSLARIQKREERDSNRGKRQWERETEHTTVYKERKHLCC